MHAAQKRQQDLERKKVPKRPRLEWLRDSKVWVPLAAALIGGAFLLTNSLIEARREDQRIATAEAKTQTAEARPMRTEEASQTAATGTAEARAQVTATPVPPAPPGETVRQFFEFLNQGEYGDAWELLDPDTRGGPSNYAIWEEFWREQGLVEVRDTEALEVTSYTATVFARLHFVSEPARERTYNVHLVFAPQQGRWLITQLVEAR